MILNTITGDFMIPEGFTGYIGQLDGTAIGTTQDFRIRATVNTFDRTLSTVYKFQDNLFLASGQTNRSNYGVLRYPALSKIKVSTISGATPVANRADISFTVTLIKDSQ